MSPSSIVPRLVGVGPHAARHGRVACVDRHPVAARRLLLGAVATTIAGRAALVSGPLLGVHPGQPWAVDGLFLACYALWFVTLFLLAGGFERGLVDCLDAASMALVGGGLVFAFLVQPALAGPAGAATGLHRFALFAAPLLDLAVLAQLFRLAVASGRSAWEALAPLGTSFAAAFVADAWSTWAAAHPAAGRHDTGIALLHATALALLAWIAVRSPAGLLAEPERRPRPVMFALGRVVVTGILAALLPLVVALRDPLGVSEADLTVLGLSGVALVAVNFVQLGLVVRAGAILSGAVDELASGNYEWRLEHRPRGLGADLVTKVNGMAQAIAGARASLVEQALRDPLTQLPNRRFFEAGLADEIARSGRTGSTFAVLMVDVDRFKDVNDALGHEAGDELLRVLAGRISGALRPGYVACRVGGDEFAVLLPSSDDERAGRVAERVRAGVDTDPVVLHDGRVVHATVSIGCAIHGLGREEQDPVVTRADEQLYRAKVAGRNRVCWESVAGTAARSPHQTLLPAEAAVCSALACHDGPGAVTMRA